MKIKYLLLAIVLFCIAIKGFAQTDSIKVIKAGRLLDVEKGTVLTNQLILIDHDTIKAIGANINIPAGVKIIDLSNATVLPGL